MGRKSHFGRRRTTTFSDGLVAFNRLGGRQFYSLFKKSKDARAKNKTKKGLMKVGGASEAGNKQLQECEYVAFAPKAFTENAITHQTYLQILC